MVSDSAVVVFDDERVVANAGVMLPASLAGRLGIEALIDQAVDLGDRQGAANPGRKVMTMLSAMALGADCIEDCDVLRSGQTAAVLGHRVAAPSTLGTFLRAFTFGHVRQLDRVLGESIERAWRAGAGPGAGRLVIDVDSFVGEVHGYRKQGAAFGWRYSIGVRMQFWVRDAIEQIPEEDWQPLADYPEGGEAEIAQTMVGQQRLVVRRTRLVGPQAELFPDWRHFAFLTNRVDALETVEAEHRQHAVVELAIRDLKDQGLQHFPSGKFNANAAWTVIACLAHSLLRWTGLIGLPGRTLRAARTLRRRLLHLPGRLTRTARRWTLHLPARWPWQHDFIRALARIRTLPAAA